MLDVITLWAEKHHLCLEKSQILLEKPGMFFLLALVVYKVTGFITQRCCYIICIINSSDDNRMVWLFHQSYAAVKEGKGENNSERTFVLKYFD